MRLKMLLVLLMLPKKDGFWLIDSNRYSALEIIILQDIWSALRLYKLNPRWFLMACERFTREAIEEASAMREKGALVRGGRRAL